MLSHLAPCTAVATADVGREPQRGPGAQSLRCTTTSPCASSHRRTPYIALEGIDGGGKTEMTRRLCARLAEAGIDCQVLQYTRIGSNRIGTIIRRLYFPERLTLGLRALDSLDFLKVLLFGYNGRVNCINLTVEGRTQLFLGDRSILTLFAMFPRGLGSRFLTHHFTRLVASGMMPDDIFVLDIDPAHALQRIMHRGQPAVNETLSQLKTVREEYLRIAGDPRWDHLTSIHLVDASQDQETVLSSLECGVHRLLRAGGADGS